MNQSVSKRSAANRAELRAILCLGAVAALSACAGLELHPAPGAQLAHGDSNAAVAQEAGIQLTVNPGDWNAFPRELDRSMIPVRATIVNNSDQPLEIEYENFSMNAVAGVTYHPLPPIDIKGSVTRTAQYPVVAPRFAFSGFYVAPFYGPYFTGLNPWVHRWHYDPRYYRLWYPRWEIDLPTHEMIELAIPEGVIEPRGRLSGFLYFPEPAGVDDGDRITFSANLVNANTDARFGRLQVPFVLQ